VKCHCVNVDAKLIQYDPTRCRALPVSALGCDVMTLHTHYTHYIIVLTPLVPYLHLCRLQLTTS